MNCTCPLCDRELYSERRTSRYTWEFWCPACSYKFPRVEHDYEYQAAQLALIERCQ